MPQNENSVCKIDEHTVEASREATQRTELCRTECEEQHCTRSRSTQDGFEKCDPGLTKKNAAPASNVNLLLEVEHR